ncbi:hypothetical protein DPMN_093776 [Dreissena polymorpha]|uniref:Uncharacterized protein n=1 Tax=Dreissena polymorpha TaxID=45954 RepID=A0A9D4R174_DREPO|nr:hypothetical protein DPMN_093776 [Dreissena polymorpha]
MNEEGSTLDSIGFIPMAKKLKVFRVSEEDLTGHNKNRFTPLCDVVTVETVEEVREKEEGVILEMLKVQPFHDHCYTTVFGERKNSDDVHQLIRRFEQEEDRKNLSFTWSLSDYPFISNKIMILAESPLNEKGQKPMPILFLRHRSPDENVPMVSKEEIIDLGEDKEEPDEMMSLMLKDYPKTKPLQGQS